LDCHCPTITAYRSSFENSPDFSVTDYYGFSTDQSSASKDLNLTIAAVDIGNGLTLTGGDGGSTDGTWQDFADYDFGTAANRYGFVQSSETPFFVIGKLIIGTATDTVFTDTGTVVVFDDALAAAGWTGLEISLDTGNVYTETNGTFIGKGNTTTTDTRPTLVFTGTGGSSAVSGCNYTNFSTMALVAGVTWVDGTWVDSDQITMSGAPSITGLTVIDPTNDAAMVITDATSMDNMADISFDGAGVGGTTADAAIEVNISAAGPHVMDMDNFAFSNRVGSSVDMYFVDQGSDRTYTITATGATPTFTKARGTDTVSFPSSETVTVTCKDSNGDPLESINIRVEQDPSGTLIDEGSTNASGIFTFSFTSSVPQDTKIIARQKAYRPNQAFDSIVSGTGMSVSFTMIDNPVVNLP